MPKKFPLVFYFLFVGVLVGLAFGLNPQVERASAQAANNKAILYFFWGDGCPHCAEAEPVLKDMVKRYPQMEVRAYEVWYNDDNQALFQKMGAVLKVEVKAVPGIFLGDKYWFGYSSDIGKEIESAVAACITSGCKDVGSGVLTGGKLDIWTATTLSQSNLPWIIGLVGGVLLLGVLAYFFILPRMVIATIKKKPMRSARRRRRAGTPG